LPAGDAEKMVQTAGEKDKRAAEREKERGTTATSPRSKKDAPAKPRGEEEGDRKNPP